MTALEVRQLPPADIAVLRALNLDPNKLESRAMILIAHRYDLDPLLGQIEIITTKQGMKPYITRDGMLDIAHRSGKLDGIVVDEERRSSSNDGWTAYVSVWRKDMTHPFRYGAQCKDTEMQAKVGNGPEMALARAERRALKRAFAIHDGEDDVHASDVQWDPDPDVIEVEEEPTSEPEPEPEPPMLVFTQSEAHAAIGQLTKAQQIEFLQKHGIAGFELPWPHAALQDAARMATEPF